MRGRLNSLNRQLDALDPPAPPGCANCVPLPPHVEVTGDELPPDPPACLSPDNCPGGVRQIVIHHMGGREDTGHA